MDPLHYRLLHFFVHLSLFLGATLHNDSHANYLLTHVKFDFDLVQTLLSSKYDVCTLLHVFVQEMEQRLQATLKPGASRVISEDLRSQWEFYFGNCIFVK